MLQALEKRHPEKVHRYVELSNVGHCPNHEAPQAVARLLSAWADAAPATSTANNNNINNNNNNVCNRRTVQLVPRGKETFREQWGEITVQERQPDEIPVSFVDRLATAFVG